jgi:hypothetical protein
MTALLRRLTHSAIFTRLIKPIVSPLYWSIKRAQRQRLHAWRDRVLQPVIEREKALLEAARRDHPDHLYCGGDPLVTIAIPTYQRGELLVNRALPPILKQTYPNFELLIVGDHCTDNTEALITDYPDPRVRFYNLPTRAAYPATSRERWCVVGVPALNKALELARGEWIAHTDDDDIWTPDHLETLLRFAQQHNLEFVYGFGRLQVSPTEWIETGRLAPDKDGRYKPFVSHSAVLYRAYLRLFPYDFESWKYDYGADANRWQRMYGAGVRMGFIDKLMVDMPLRPQELKREFIAPK